MRKEVRAQFQWTRKMLVNFAGPAIFLFVIVLVLNYFRAPALLLKESNDRQRDIERSNQILGEHLANSTNELAIRRHSLQTDDPVFPNTIYLLEAFNIYRHARNGEPCVIRVTAPTRNAAAMASMVAQFSDSVSDCLTFGPDMNFDLNPGLEKEVTDGMVQDAIVFHAARDDIGANVLFSRLGEHIKLIRSYKLAVFAYSIPKQKGPVRLIWLQFGPDVRWNSQR